MHYTEKDEERIHAPVQETEEDLCRALWLAVAIQALIDASGKGGSRIEQTQSREWLKGAGGIRSDIAAVCDLANIDFEATRKRFAKVLDSQSEPIDFRCMKKAIAKNRNLECRKRYFRRAERNARIRIQQRKRILFPNASMMTDPANDNSIRQHLEQAL
jgi:hypothetical protein